MVKFEEGKIYRSRRGDDFLRVTKRTDKTLWFTFLNTRGKEYNLHYKFRKILLDYGSECVRFSIGLFSSEDVVDDFDAIVAAQLTQDAQKEQRRKDSIDKDKQKILDFLEKNPTISFDFMMTCSDFVWSVSSAALEEVAKQLHSTYFMRDDE